MSAIENQETVIQAVNSLHPTTLFHFTKNEEAFYSILTELYFKPFLARERIVGKPIENYIYADEKEWRYVPHPFVGDLWPSLNLERVVEPNQKAVLSKKFSEFGISFSFDDIKYILVPDDSHISKLITCLMSIRNYDPYIISKVLTMDKVKQDF
ncbi:abortive infection system antitoxin AbiGi family protein [Escherichia coli]